jgi:hypothetical protein
VPHSRAVPLLSRACWNRVCQESNDLFEDCRTGLPLLQLEDHLRPGVVDWSRVHLHPKSIYERVENCNQAIEVARKLKMKVVSIDGNDIAQGSPKLTLAILWQLMRAHTHGSHRPRTPAASSALFSLAIAAQATHSRRMQ